jgi:hypothetical protein
MLNVIKYPESIEYLLFKYRRLLKHLPPLPIPASAAGKYAKHVASYSDMLFIRRCLLYSYSRADLDLISRSSRHLDWYIQLTTAGGLSCMLNPQWAYLDLPRDVRMREDIKNQYNITENVVSKSYTEYETTGKGRDDKFWHADIFFAINSEIKYDRTTAMLYNKIDAFSKGAFVVFYWAMVSDKEFYYYDGKFMSELPEVSVSIFSLEQSVMVYLSTQLCNAYDMCSVNDTSYMKFIHKAYDASQYHMIRIGRYDAGAKVIRDITCDYLPAPRYRAAVFDNITRVPNMYKDLRILL